MSSPARRQMGAATLVVAVLIGPAVLVGPLWIAAGPNLEAQSLADVARQEEARRKTVTAPGKIYTNDNVRAVPPSPAEPTSAAEAPPPSASDQASSGEATKAAPADAAAKAAPVDAAAAAGPAPVTEKQDQAYWQKRLTTARDSLSRAQLFAEALQSRINALTTDFTNRDDPAQRAVIAKDRQKALAELDRLRKEIQDGTKAIAQIQEEGRRAGAPAGWLR